MEKRVFEDPAIPSFLKATGQPFKITPQRNSSGRVEFCVTGDGIDAQVASLYDNAQVGALDFIQALKNFRSAIFTLKKSKPVESSTLSARNGKSSV